MASRKSESSNVISHSTPNRSLRSANRNNGCKSLPSLSKSSRTRMNKSSNENKQANICDDIDDDHGLSRTHNSLIKSDDRVVLFQSKHQSLTVNASNNLSPFMGKINEGKSTNLQMMLEAHDNRVQLRNLDHQHTCIAALSDAIFTTDQGSIISKKIAQEIIEEFHCLPPPNDHFYPIIRFDAKKNPRVEFHFQNSFSPFHIMEEIVAIDYDIINTSKLIYSFIFELYQQSKLQ